MRTVQVYPLYFAQSVCAVLNVHDCVLLANSKSTFTVQKNNHNRHVPRSDEEKPTELNSSVYISAL